MKPFKEYFWKHILNEILFSWFILCLLSLSAYSSVIVFLKNKELSSGLNLAAYTVQKSVEASDWSLALDHLIKLEQSGPVFHIKLSGNAENGNLTGPFGDKPIGIGTTCKSVSIYPDLKLSGCMRVFGTIELISLFLFLIIIFGLFYFVFRNFRSKILLVIENTSNSLQKIRYLDNSANLESTDEFDNIDEIRTIRKYIFDLLREAEAASKAIALNQISAQVAHDIRTPLATLEIILHDINYYPSEKRMLIRNTINQIHGIADNLLHHYRLNQDKKNPHIESKSSLIVGMLDIIISEYRARFQNKNVLFDMSIEKSAYLTFTSINHIEFKRMISNILNNSIDAINNNGTINIRLTSDINMAVIVISDSGCGIDDKILNLLPAIGSVKKFNGSGLGLKHAFSLIESHGGKIEIQSRLGIGTSVSIIMPLISPPA